MATGCAGIAARLGEPLVGTAPQARGWLLLEHQGAWDAEAPASLLDPVIARDLGARCAAAGVRLLAVRRTRARGVSDPRRCYAVSSAADAAWIQRINLAEPKDLLDIDIAAVGRGHRPHAGIPMAGPMFAVCTHGRRDACCAEHGRPVHRALGALAPTQVWEASHLGGHRFASNVLVLPQGVVYGRVGVGDVGTIVTRTHHGRVVPELLRGRSALAPAAQAADWFVRRATGLTGLDDVVVDDAARTAAVDGPDAGPPAERWMVLVRARGEQLLVELDRVAPNCPRATTCGGEPVEPATWRLRAMPAIVGASV